MRGLLLAALIPVVASPAGADVLLAARTLRAGSLIGAADVVLDTAAPPPGAATDPGEAVGLEARVTLYGGRPIPVASLGPPAVVERNQLVVLVFRHAGLEIRADGRALDRGAAGDAVRIMNLASRSTLSGTVAGPGLVSVP